jgi:hypothetical protein
MVKINVCSPAVFVPVDRYGGNCWSDTLRGEHWLRVFENRVLGRALALRVTGEWRKLHYLVWYLVKLTCQLDCYLVTYLLCLFGWLVS